MSRPFPERLPPLPIDEFLPAIRDALARSRSVIVVAPPGAGKTTRVPPALVADGPVLCLQPRRVAARALARRIAFEQGWRLGEEIGWQIRFENRFSRRTRLLIATEGILTARLQNDPLLTDFRTIVLDELHERSIHADLALAFAREAMAARGDLRLVVMSATLDAKRVSSYLGGSPIVHAPGRLHPVTIEYAPASSLDAVVRQELQRTDGDVLCFLPGTREIRDAASRLRDLAGVEVHELHGSLPVEVQERAIVASSRRKVVLSTNVAETSLTVEGIRTVVDSGLHKVSRYESSTGVDRLVVERISIDSAVQRAGRAGRLAPGRAVRLWDRNDILDEHREPEIQRVDLAAPLLDVIAWGGDPHQFAWLDPPAPERSRSALRLLERLGATEENRLTPQGELMRRMPLHPRLAKLLLECRGSASAAAICAAIAEGYRPSRTSTSSESDLLVIADTFAAAPRHLHEVARELQRIVRETLGHGGRGPDEQELRRAVLAAFPDRLARRRAARSDRFLLATGHGANLARESTVRTSEWIVAVEVTGMTGPQGAGGRPYGRGTPEVTSEALVRLASAVEREWVEPTHSELRHWVGEDGRIRAARIRYYDAIVIDEVGAAPDPTTAAEMVLAELRRRPFSEENLQFLHRARVSGVELDPGELLERAAAGRERVPERIELEALAGAALLREVDRKAPRRINLPSGRSVALDYREDGTVFAAAKLQELFGMLTTPRVANGVPVTFELLAPNGRPVQTTRDLESFWRTTYSEVRKQLRGRYPKHPWPEDPYSAKATSKTKKKSEK